MGMTAWNINRVEKNVSQEKRRKGNIETERCLGWGGGNVMTGAVPEVWQHVALTRTKKIPTFRRAVFKSKICPISEMTVLFVKKFPPSSVVECMFKRTHSNHSLSVTLTHIHSSFLCLWYLRTADLHRQRPPLSFFFFHSSKWTLGMYIYIFEIYFFPVFL